jgi:hypothetical protein
MFMVHDLNMLIHRCSYYKHRHSNSGPPFSSFGPSRDYGMDLCLEIYLWTIYPYFTTFRVTTLSFPHLVPKKVPKIFPTNEIARNKICSAMDKWFKDIFPDKDPYHNRGRDQMRKKGGPEFECLCVTPAVN